MNNRKLITLFLIVFIDLLGFSIILPLLPFYAETFDATPLQIGFLVAWLLPKINLRKEPGSKKSLPAKAEKDFSCFAERKGFFGTFGSSRARHTGSVRTPCFIHSKILPHFTGLCGEKGIRTPGALAGTTVFETAPFDHSGTSPRGFGLYAAAAQHNKPQIAAPDPANRAPAAIPIGNAAFDWRARRTGDQS